MAAFCRAPLFVGEYCEGVLRHIIIRIAYKCRDPITCACSGAYGSV